MCTQKGACVDIIDKKLCSQKENNSSKPMIFIEGNVGVGKSTFLRFLHEKLGTHVLYEPNVLWQDIEGHNLLAEFFKDPVRWAYTCQSYILSTRIDQMIFADTIPSGSGYLVERSVYSGRYIFAEVAQEIGTMNGLEWSLYKKLWDREIKRVLDLPAGFIYLRTPSEICYERIVKRGRTEEAPITMDYLKRIEEKHENWFVKKEIVDQDLAHASILILDFSKDFYNDELLQNEYVAKVKDFIVKVLSISGKK
jgi:deoxyadenosine/deoxycytidine kinase